MSFRTVLAAIALILSTSFAGAGEILAYTEKAFGAAQAEGKPIVIHVTASWCPTCRAQTPIVESLAADDANPDLVVFTVDFDTEGEVLRAFGVRHQSTLIAFRGGEERMRSVGETSRDGIAALVAATN